MRLQGRRDPYDVDEVTWHIARITDAFNRGVPSDEEIEDAFNQYMASCRGYGTQVQQQLAATSSAATELDFYNF